MAEMSIRSQAIAFRIWQYCEPVGWDRTCGQIADELGVNSTTVSNVLYLKGWGTRIRASVSRRGKYA